MTIRELLKQAVENGSAEFLAPPEALLARVTAPKAAHRRSTGRRRPFVALVAAAVLLFALAITGFAGVMGWISFDDLYRLLGVGWNQMEEGNPQYGVIERQLASVLRRWNSQRLALGMDQGDVSKIISALGAGDLDLAGIYDMYGKQPLNAQLVAQVTDLFPDLPALEREVKEGEARMGELYPKYKDRAMTLEETLWWEDYQEKTSRMYLMQDEISQELVALQDLMDDPSLWSPQIPEAWRMTEAPVPLIADMGLETDAVYIQLILERYLPALLTFDGAIAAVPPAPEDVLAAAENAWSEEREARYPDGIHPEDFSPFLGGAPLTVTREAAEREILRFFPQTAEVLHGAAEDEMEAIRTEYDPDAGLYTARFVGIDNPPAQWQVYVLDIQGAGARRTATAAILKMVDDGQTRTLETPDGREVHRFPSRQLISLTRYELSKILAELPKWEVVAQVEGKHFVNSRGDTFAYGLSDYRLTEIRPLGVVPVEDAFLDKDGTVYRIDEVVVAQDDDGQPIPLLDPDSVFDGACVVEGDRITAGADDVAAFAEQVKNRATATLVIRSGDGSWLQVVTAYPDRIQTEEYTGYDPQSGVAQRWSREIPEAAITGDGVFTLDEYGSGWWLEGPPDYFYDPPPEWDAYVRPLTGVSVGTFDDGHPPQAGAILLFLDSNGLLAGYTPDGMVMEAPAGEFEALAAAYFPVEAELLRESFLYRPEQGVYRYDWSHQSPYGNPRGDQEAYGESYVIPTVWREDGKVIITVCYQYSPRRYEEVRLTVLPREDGSWQYLSREVVMENWDS